MDKRFYNIFGLTEEQAIAILKAPVEELEDKTDRYVAVSHLINFPTEQSIDALIEAVENQDPEMYNRITRRKALESLGRLQAERALPSIVPCLSDEDIYTVENAVWAIGEIGTEDEGILAKITQLLELPQQSYRTIIQVLSKLKYQAALEPIKKFVTYSEEPIASAAIAAVAGLTKDYSQIDKVVEFLQHTSVNARRASIQDLIDAQYYGAIPDIAKCPVSLVFRLRGIRLLAEKGIPSGEITFTNDVEPYLDQVIRDRPEDLELVHEYDQPPSLDFAIAELYHTDFGRCYLASKTILEIYLQEAGEALMAAYEDKAYNDYGAHYHVMKLLGWLKYEPGYDLLLESLYKKTPQFQKSRGAAAIALGNLGKKEAIPFLKENLKSPIFDLKYACLLALEQLGETQTTEFAAQDQDFLIQAKASM